MLGGVALLGAVAVIFGVGYAFFSDIITGDGTATSGTLDIRGTVGLERNGTAVGGSTVSNFNPGDVIGIDASSVTNYGTASAWIRGVLEFTSISNTDNLGGSCSDTNFTTQATCEAAAEDWTPAAADAAVGNLADWLWVCSDGETQADLIAASFAGTLGTDDTSGSSGVDTSSCVLANTTDVFGAKTTYAAPGDVISGTAEADGSSTTWTPDASFVIYFDAAAPNAAQNGNATFEFLIQALQFRNNTTSPTETQWSTVTTAQFAL